MTDISAGNSPQPSPLRFACGGFALGLIVAFTITAFLVVDASDTFRHGWRMAMASARIANANAYPGTLTGPMLAARAEADLWQHNPELAQLAGLNEPESDLVISDPAEGKASVVRLWNNQQLASVFDAGRLVGMTQVTDAEGGTVREIFAQGEMTKGLEASRDIGLAGLKAKLDAMREMNR